jgi:hypothetical protein
MRLNQRITKWCQNCKFKRRPRIKKRESERRRFVNRNKSLIFFAVKQQWSRRLLLSSAPHRLKLIFLLIRFALWSICPILLHCSSSFWPLKQRPKRRRLTSISKKKIDQVSAGFDRVARVPGRPAGSIGFHRANSRASFCLHPDRSQARVDPPGLSRF